MFERFTEGARRVVVLAQDEAVQKLKPSHIGTEHVLLGLLREEEGLAGRVLQSWGVTVELVRGHLAQIVCAQHRCQPRRLAGP